jgi:competence protein ComEA
MKKLVSDFFFYNRKQKIGVLVFSCITIINVCIIAFEPVPTLEKEDHTELLKEFELMEQQLQAVDDDSQDPQIENIIVEKRLEKFDPNTASKDLLIQVGLSEKVADRIIKFRTKGWKFRTKESLRKIYGISESQYAELEPYVVIKMDEFRSDENKFEVKKKERICELNTADSLQLCDLPGIGAGFARRIIKFREKLGGFIKKEQLLEVYGLDSSKFDIIQGKITVDGSVVRKVNINLIAESDLAKHPYVGFKLAKKINSYKKQHGNFSSISDVEKISTINAQELEKIAPYITFEE